VFASPLSVFFILVSFSVCNVYVAYKLILSSSVNCHPCSGTACVTCTVTLFYLGALATIVSTYLLTTAAAAAAAATAASAGLLRTVGPHLQLAHTANVSFLFSSALRWWGSIYNKVRATHIASFHSISLTLLLPVFYKGAHTTITVPCITFNQTISLFANE